MRVGAVDVGSNALRYAVAELRASGSPEIIESERAPVRLGHLAFRTGRLEPERIDLAIDTLRRFRKRFDACGVAAHRVVATSAVRDSANGHELVRRAREEAGFHVEVISGEEEARLVWAAVRDRVPLDGRWLVADLGGGSLEVILVEDASVVWSRTYPAGTVRLKEILLPTAHGSREQELAAGAAHGSRGPHPAAAASALERAVREKLDALGLAGTISPPLRVIATGGNATALAKLARAKKDDHGVSRLPLETLRGTTARAAALTPDERVRELRVEPDRADVIVPAAVVYAWIAERAGADVLVIPHVGVVDGVLIELAATVSSPSR